MLNRWAFKCCLKVSVDLHSRVIAGNEFQTDSAATEKARREIWVLVPPVIVSSWCGVTVSTRSVVGPSQWLVRCPGTHYRTVSASRHVMTFQMTVKNIHWKHLSLVDIDVPSAVKVFMILRYINVHLLTYLGWHLMARDYINNNNMHFTLLYLFTANRTELKLNKTRTKIKLKLTAQLKGYVHRWWRMVLGQTSATDTAVQSDWEQQAPSTSLPSDWTSVLGHPTTTRH